MPLWTVVSGAFVVCDVILRLGEASFAPGGGDGLLEALGASGRVGARILDVLKFTKLALVRLTHGDSWWCAWLRAELGHHSDLLQHWDINVVARSDTLRW